MITSPSASSDAVVLYSTGAGSAVQRDDDRVTLTFNDLAITLPTPAINELRDSARSLAADVRRCGSDCRWQLRVPQADQRMVIVLTSEDVLALDDLVSGASAMMELNAILEETAIDVR
ncbi:citrate synthase [Longibacter salinarum]|uniref:Citrate synthase n=1 Tax=Longibacter salinarum TaxID=1850348 RepID=A0A2A8D0F2_9BACT|nr:citrate synthase [Longibacter salinarum]PEN14449.1 citrate synthase [Longibacter salinarum]